MSTLTVIHTDDIHASWNGLPRLAVVVEHARRTAQPVLFLDGGDLGVSPGWKRSGVVMPLLRELRWDAVALSDSEASLFGTCPENLKMLRRVSDHALVCNIAPLLIGTDPFIIFPMRDLRVAVFGVTQPRSDEQGKRIDDPDIFAVTGRVVRMLRPEADILIMIGHLGLSLDCRIAEQIEGIDLIVGGDSHHRLIRPLRVGTALIGHAGDLAMVAGRMTASVRDGRVATDSQIIHLGRSDFVETFGDETAWRERLLNIVGASEPTLIERLATCDDLWGDNWRENGVANYVADRLREAFGTELVVIESHFASPQWREEITRWDLHASIDMVYPYFYHVEMTGAQIRRLFEERAAYYEDRERLSEERFAQIESCTQLPGNPYHLSGGSVVIDLNRSPGERVVRTEVGGVEVDDERTYRVTVSEIASASSFWVRQIYHHERKRFDVMPLLEADLRRRGHLESIRDGRLRVIEAFSDQPSALS
jgi:2',3'-cyclic-nucleotide 2'-phosphodiesterase (5'-nucleotidase family)